MSLDRNQTVWQRLEAAIRPHVADDTAARRLTDALHPHVIAERENARGLLGMSYPIHPGSVVIHGVPHPMPPPAAFPMSDREMFDHLGRKGMIR